MPPKLDEEPNQVQSASIDGREERGLGVSGLGHAGQKSFAHNHFPLFFGWQRKVSNAILSRTAVPTQ